MITKTDCLLLLKDLSDNGIDTTEQINKLYKENDIVGVISFINTKRQIDLSAFYENLRKNYNKKKSNLYINIVKSDEEGFKGEDTLTTLSSLLLQIMLYSKRAKNSQMFLKHSRADEITKVIAKYLNTYDITPCVKLLTLIKADLKVLESAKAESTN